MKQLAALAAAFTLGAALPPAAVWIATRGPGSSAPVISDPIDGAEHARAVAHEHLDTWSWADRDRGLVHMPIDRAIEHYLADHAR